MEKLARNFCIAAFIALLVTIMLCLPAGWVFGAVSSWEYGPVYLGYSVDSMKYTWRVDYVVSDTHTVTHADSLNFLYFNISAQDSVSQWFTVELWDSDFSNSGGFGAWRNQSWSTDDDSVYIPKVLRFWETVDTLITKTAIRPYGGSKSTTTDTATAVDSVIDSLKVKDNDEVHFSWTQIYNGGSEYVGFGWSHDAGGPVDTIITGSDTLYDTIYAPTPPGGDSTCVVWGWLYDNKGNGVPFADVKFTMTQPAWNTCDSVAIADLEYTTETRLSSNDSTGYFQIELIKSSCLSDSTEYAITVEIEKGSSIHKYTAGQIYIPSDSTTYKILLDLKATR